MNNVISHLLRMGYPIADIEAVVIENGIIATLKKFGMTRKG